MWLGQRTRWDVGMLAMPLSASGVSGGLCCPDWSDNSQQLLSAKAYRARSDLAHVIIIRRELLWQRLDPGGTVGSNLCVCQMLF